MIASIKLDDLMAAFAPEGSSAAQRHCSAISLAWISDTAVTVVLKQEHEGKISRKLFVFSCTGYAAELKLEGDEVCHVSTELDGCVVLGEQTWTLVRDVPVAVQRVGPHVHVCLLCNSFQPSCGAVDIRPLTTRLEARIVEGNFS